MSGELSNVEKVFLKESGVKEMTTRLPYIVTESFPRLGLLASLSFLEWIISNPEGVICLPTGKSAQHFIRFTQNFLQNWDSDKSREIFGKYGLEGSRKPDLSGLHFVQAAEFYPIPSVQHNSLNNYVRKYYIEGLGLDPEKALLINSDEINLTHGKSYTEIFPDYLIDLSLRYREARSHQEDLQKQSILAIDNWCTVYEQKIREKNGIGFFLGGIGPDGHIAFNTRGSGHFSATRLTETNFETQAVAATDLGGIEVSRTRLVITIGLGTITFNQDARAIIYAAGESNADIVKASLENGPSDIYPATVLQRIKNGRFYLTQGAAVKLNDSLECYYKCGSWTHQKTERAVIDLCSKINKFGSKLELADLKADRFCSMIPGLNDNTVQTVIDSIKEKINKGMKKDSDQIYYHTGPHHDDIMLGIMPLTNRQSRNAGNRMHFSVLTSGFTAVTNKFLIELLNDTKRLLNQNSLEMVNYPDFFEDGYRFKWDKDVYHYLDNVASRDEEEKRRGVCHRLVRAMVEIWKIRDKEELRDTIYDCLSILKRSYDGSKNPPKIQQLKGMIREFEEELVWAHYGIRVSNVHHLRLGFYQGDTFSNQPDFKRDVEPVLKDFRKYKPTAISLAMDPEGSGPDTHYKVLQAIARAVEAWSKEEDLSNLKIIGYRNVWFRYHPADVEMIVPVTLNSLATLEKSFSECYITQVNASFPSYQHDGKFSELTQRVWMEQHKQIQLLLGKNFFFQNDSPLLRATHGLVYVRELNVENFLKEAFKLEKSTESL
jgi:glucosamine-6-phosphate deaminase